jgi:hypothetical protein
VGLSNGSTLYVTLKPGLEGFLCPESKKMKNENKETTVTTTTTASTTAAAAIAAATTTTTTIAATTAAAAATTLLLLTLLLLLLLLTSKNAHGLLKPVPEMVKETCSNEICLSMVLTHSKILETWQATAKLGQHEARQILAKMLKTSSECTNPFLW